MMESSLRQKLETLFAPEHLELENESHQHGGGPRPGEPPRETHFRLVLVSSLFENKSRVDRQRQVMDLFAEERRQGLHALTMRLMTPQEWQSVKDHFVMESPDCHGGSKHEKKRTL